MTTPLFSERNEFMNGTLSKPDYITTMHEKYHQLLFAYSSYLKDTDIAKIEIMDGKVVMTTREHGLRILCDPNDQRTFPIETLNFGAYEQDELDCIFDKLSTNSTILDIGANCGFYSLQLAKRYPDSQVYAFEPIPATFKYLQQNLALNNITNVTAYNVGLSNQEGTFPVYFYKGGTGNSSLENLSDREEIELVECQFRQLNSYIDEIPGPIDFMKCDVEGAELWVVEGGLEVIQRHQPILFLELLRKWAAKFNYHPNDVLHILEGIGYRCFVFTSGRMVPIEEINDQTVETNFIFLHNEKHASLI
ncbi:FkbM family methyltransferase [Paenibacillus sp. P96]|uniref:FkbM family methyltransferase n=1 Tax=Paenibacillus zeirhizosphaerae TaxID=2987519 RepID=A0ABT9FXD3_9BACL|nr:FkbM family methyltransferase [Paenibacillus sp. P96]MDP4099345.1 FkbM family methyltransferase [Paenibacillus sp. P96]